MAHARVINYQICVRVLFSYYIEVYDGHAVASYSDRCIGNGRFRRFARVGGGNIITNRLAASGRTPVIIDRHRNIVIYNDMLFHRECHQTRSRQVTSMNKTIHTHTHVSYTAGRSVIHVYIRYGYYTCASINACEINTRCHRRRNPVFGLAFRPLRPLRAAVRGVDSGRSGGIFLAKQEFIKKKIETLQSYRNVVFPSGNPLRALACIRDTYYNVYATEYINWTRL